MHGKVEETHETLIIRSRSDQLTTPSSAEYTNHCTGWVPGTLSKRMSSTRIINRGILMSPEEVKSSNTLKNKGHYPTLSLTRENT